MNCNSVKTIPVMEMYINAKSQYESDGYSIFKKTMTITQEQLQMIKNIKRNEEDIEDVFSGENIDKNFKQEEIREFLNIVADYGVGYLDKDYISDIAIQDDLECIYDYKYPMYLEFKINKESCIDGYVSVYELPIEEFNEQDSVNVHLKKNITHN